MKKSIVFAAIFMFVLGSAFAQTQAAPEDAAAAEDPAYDYSTHTTIVTENHPDLHPKSKTVEVKIEYTPLTDEVRIYYTTMAVSFEKSEAMNTCLACLEDFQKEKQYYHYDYKDSDKIKYYKDNRGIMMAQYMSYLKFKR